MSNAARPKRIADTAAVVPTALYPVPDAAGFLGVGVSTMWGMVAKGLIPVVYITPGKSGTRRILGQALLDYIEGATRVA